MKHSKYFCFFIIPLLVFICASQPGVAQSNSDQSDAKKAAFKNMVDSQHFVFVAQSATPLTGGLRNLTSYYDVTVAKDTLISSLPYFGRAYTAPINSDQSPLNFTSTNFSYTVTPAKKNGWNVLIKLRDNTDVQEYRFTIYDNGSASLSVNSTSRDAISFLGYVVKGHKKKKK